MCIRYGLTKGETLGYLGGVNQMIVKMKFLSISGPRATSTVS